jgi:hypothetical protein
VALAQHTEGLKFLVALRSGGDSAEQRRIEHFVLSGYPLLLEEAYWFEEG